MARMSRPETKQANPAKRFIEWKSNDKCFSYYDKEKQENVQLELPQKWVFIEHYHTVKGWDDKSESAITSNEVFSIGTEQLKVRSYKGGEIATGLYKDNKSKIKDRGGVYHRSIYAMDENGDLINISLKGSAVQAYSSFMEEHKKKVEGTNWFGVEDFKEGKKGSIKFSSPEFVILGTTSAKDERNVSSCVSALEEYMEEYKKRPLNEDADEDSDMPF